MNNDHIVFSSKSTKEKKEKVTYWKARYTTLYWWTCTSTLIKGRLRYWRWASKWAACRHRDSRPKEKWIKKRESICSERTDDIFKHKKWMEVSWNEGKAYGLEKTNDIFTHIKRRRWKFLKRGRPTTPTDNNWQNQAYKETRLRILGKKENLMLSKHQWHIQSYKGTYMRFLEKFKERKAYA